MKELFMRGGKLSHSKTLIILSWVVATIWGSIKLYKGILTDDFVSYYLGAFVLNVIGASATTAYRDKPIDKPFVSTRNRDQE